MADRTVSVQLRADVSAYLARMRAASAATRRLGDDMERTSERANIAYERMRGGADRLERQLRRLAEAQRETTRRSSEQSESTRRSSDSTERHTRSTERNTRAQQDNTRGLTASRSTLVSLVAAAGAVVPAIVSAGVAVTAFGALAAPSIIKVVAAQKDLSASWTSLSGQQRISAIQVRSLTSEYKALARSYEPQALLAFNTIIGTARGLLPQLGAVVAATGDDVQRLVNRLASFVSGRVGGEFLSWAGQRAPEALNVLGTTAITAGDTALDLVQDLEPLAISLLKLTNGALSVVNGIAGINPAMAQLLISAVLLRAPIVGLVGGFRAISGRIAAYAAATAGAGIATRALGVAAAAGPALWITAAGAIALWAFSTRGAKSDNERFIDTMAAQNRAFGNNIAGYRAQIVSLRQREAALSGNARTEEQARNAAFRHGKEIARLQKEVRDNEDAIRKVSAGATILASRYNITTDQAIRLADAAGVDLSKSLDKSGNLSAEATKKIAQYAEAARLANDPTRQVALALADAGNKALTLKDRVTALTTALDAVFNPSLAAYQATTQLKEGYRRLSEELARSKGRLDGNSASSLQARAAFAQQLQAVSALAQAELRRTGSMDVARAAVARQLPILYALAGANRGARNQVDALARSFGINTGATYVSRGAFMANAASMGITKSRAAALWQEFQRLTGRTNLGSASLSTYINRVRTTAGEASRLASRTSAGASTQSTYNGRVRAALPVLYALAGNNRAARAQVDALARSTGNATGATNTSRRAFLAAASTMGIARGRAEQLWRELNKIKSRQVKIDVTGRGGWSVQSGKFFYHATGGKVVGDGVPGATRARDSVPAMLRVDEHVLTPEEVDAIGGHQAVYRMRAAALRGEFAGFSAGGHVQRRQGYARGGAVSFSHDRRSNSAVVGDVTSPITGGINSMLRSIARKMAADWKKYMASGGAALGWARAQAGKPYVWGGVGPGGFDCSGFMSAIVNVIRRRNPHSRLFTTHAFTGPTGPAGFVRGLQSPFTVGVSHGGVGHMAGTLSGVDVESGGGPQGSRVYVGAGASGTSDFPNRYGLRMARGGRVDDRLAERALRRGDRDDVALAASLGLIGDPSSRISPVNPEIPGYAAGGWVRGRVGERVPIAAHAGEFMVNRTQAQANGPLLEALNSGLGEALLNRSVRGVLVRGGDGAAIGGGSLGGDVHVHLHNHGAIGSKIEMQDWLAGGLDELRRQGRLPRP